MMYHSLSQSQLGILIAELNNTGEGTYNIMSLFALDGSVELPRLKYALEKAGNAHPMLKARLCTDKDGNYVFEDRREEPFFVDTLDFADKEELLAHARNVPYFLTSPLYRAEICRTSDTNYLFVDFHHLISDGYSTQLFLNDVSAAYSGKEIEAEKISGFELTAEELAARETPRYGEDKAYFTSVFSDAAECPSLPVPDICVNAEEHFLSRTQSLDIDAAALDALCEKLHTTEARVFTAAFAFTLAKFTGSDEALFSTAFHGRNDPRTDRTFTMLVRTLPVYQNISNITTVSELILNTGRQLSGTRKHPLYSYSEAAVQLGLNIESTFVYHGKLRTQELCLDGRHQIFTDVTLNTPGLKFVCHMKGGNGNYELECEYPCNLFSAEYISGFISFYEHIVNELLHKETLADISLLSQAQKELLDGFNRTEAEYDTDRTVVDLFREKAAQRPDGVAVIFRERTYTYRETDRISDCIALYLMKKGIGREDVVSVLIERSEFMPIVSLGVLKAGAAYQPLDPSYPDERLSFMVKDASAKLLISDSTLTDKLADWDGETLLTEDICALPDESADEREALLAAAPKKEDLFILLYTSGSTGTPKGVMLEHGGIAAFCHQHISRLGLDDTCVVAAYASYGFDANMMDTYPALCAGARLVIVHEDIRLDITAINEYYKKLRVTHAFMTTQVGRQFAQLCDSPYMKVISLGGEALVPVTAKNNIRLINMYGPTEGTVYVTAFELEGEYRRVPIGRAVDNVKLYAADKNMNRLPACVPGELCIAGRQVSKGYLNRPEKTAEAFLANPFDTEEGYEHIYRTGDIVRILPDGTVDFVGRNDGQVKVRGFRIELTEVEEVIRRFDVIRDATVVAFDAPSGGKELAAYIVSDETVDIKKLKDFIRSEKPAYMVPAVVMQIDAIPLTQNQKVNRRALPAPVLTAEKSTGENASALPLNALEKRLKEIASEIVGTESFGLTDEFSCLGLNSISAIRLATVIYKKYGVSVKAAELISGGTLRTLEDAVLASWLEEKKPSEKNVEKQEQTEIRKTADAFCHLSFTQQGVYAECMASPESTRYNTPFCIALPDSVSAKELREAVRKVVLAHPSFSIRFTVNDKNETVQYFLSGYEPEIPIKEMSAEEFAARKREFVRPFALTDEALSRFEIVKADRLYLLTDVHHLITDGASMDIFLRQLCACLDGEAVEKEEYTYFDHIADEKITPETESFFEEYMADCEDATRLIPDIFEEGLSHSEGSVSVKTDLKAVSGFAAENGVTPAAVYLAAEYIACSRYVCEDSAAVSTISNGRRDLRIHNTLGMFVNTLPLTVKLDSSEGTVSFVKRAAENYAAVIEHENYPFAAVAKKFDFHPSLSYTYQVGVIDKYTARGAKLETEGLSLDMAKLPCSVYITGSVGDGGSIQINYDEAMYSESMMRSFAESIENAVRGLMSKSTLSEISLTNEAQQKILDSYNRPFDLAYDHSDTAVSLFRKQAAAHPDKTAAVYKDKEYTFRELDELSDRLAELIYGELSDITGLESLAEQVVPIIASRSENTFILPLAVLKTGSAYEPLDPDYPSDRLSFMVKDAGARLLLAERGLEERIGGFDGKVIFIDELYTRLEAAPHCHIEDIPAPKPQDLLIMLYTSGTTGVPKGVQLIHENIVSFAHGSALDGLYTAESRTATYASFGFDVNMADTFCTMLNGGTVCLIPEDARMNLEALAAYFDEAEITDVLLTTQVGVQFIGSFPKLKTLRMLTVGGEKLPAINTAQLSYTVYNGYGPTENCAGVSIFPIRHWEANIPIGKPFPSINAYVLDKTGHRLPAGAAGEYCLSGPQVGRGYLNRPDKTAEAFEKCPFNDFRMYHTGDIVRYRENGDVEFVGRKDGQVKIRGFRVELKEIEAVIRDFEGIEDVTVQAYDYESGGKYLAAFIVGKNIIDTKELSEFIKSRKPAYMVPAAVSQINEIPLTVNRKVDKKALPKPEVQKGEYTPPQTKAEEDFCRILGEILGIEKVSVEDDFFELGGSSISAMKVVLAAGKAGYEIVYQDVFDYSTPRLLASAVEDSTCVLPASENTPVSTDSESPYGPNTTEIGRDGYDYSRINALLRKNTLDAFRNGSCREVGDVLLTGSTGFLGIHVLHDLIVNSESRIFCLSRSKNGVSGEVRLKELLTYYFETDYSDLFGSRLFIIEGDATNADTLRQFAPEGEITVINCAANVAHFAKGDAIWRANVNSVENLISWCVEHKARLVHVSTGSVSGASDNGVPGDGFKLDEHVLFAGQLVENNQYVHSKFMAERLIYEAILEKGLSAKVMRVSNLAPRFSDGMVQINYATNNFLSSLKAFRALGAVSYDMMGQVAEFSPIDCVARAILTLAQTPEECVCFVLANEYMPKMGSVILQLSTPENEIRMVEPEQLRERIGKAMEAPNGSELMRPLLAYAGSKKEGDVRTYGFDVMDASQTLQILYRLGFSWPVTDGAYVRRFAARLEKLGFFG